MLCSVFTASNTGAVETVNIAVFEQHQRYINASGAYALSWRLMEAAAALQNIKLQPIESSWQGAISRLKGGKVPLVFAAFKTKERQQWAIFSLPLAPDSSAIFTLPDNPVGSRQHIDFKSASIGVSAGSVQERFAKELGFKNIYSTKERAQLYRMLEEGRLTYLFFGQSMIGYYCLYHANLDNRDCMRQVGEPYDINEVHTIALKSELKAKQLMDRLNQGLLAISQSQDIALWFAEEGFTQRNYSQWQFALQKHTEALH